MKFLVKCLEVNRIQGERISCSAYKGFGKSRIQVTFRLEEGYAICSARIDSFLSINSNENLIAMRESMPETIHVFTRKLPDSNHSIEMIKESDLLEWMERAFPSKEASKS